MRKILLFAVATFLATRSLFCTAEPNTDAILALEGKALFQASERIGYAPDSKISTEDLIKIAAKLGAQLPQLDKEDDARFAFGHVFATACERASGSQVEKLVEIYVALESDDFDKGYQFAPLATAWILREIERRSDFPKVELPAPTEALPTALADAPPELIAAWQLSKRATQTFESTKPTPTAVCRSATTSSTFRPALKRPQVRATISLRCKPTRAAISPLPSPAARPKPWISVRSN